MKICLGTWQNAVDLFDRRMDGFKPRSGPNHRKVNNNYRHKTGRTSEEAQYLLQRDPIVFQVTKRKTVPQPVKDFGKAGALLSELPPE